MMCCSPAEPMDGVEIITFGCRLNAAESEAMRRLADGAGLGNAVIVNTCAVTAEAERQARQAIRRARREHPEARIIVTGCAATLAPERYAELAEVDLVLDNQAKLRAQSYARVSALESPTSPQPSPPPGAERELLRRPSFPSPPFRGEREGPTPQAWEGEVGRGIILLFAATAGGPPTGRRAGPAEPDAAAGRCGGNRGSSRPPARSPRARRDGACSARRNPRAPSRPG